jgi:hypothetical protein
MISRNSIKINKMDVFRIASSDDSRAGKHLGKIIKPFAGDFL